MNKLAGAALAILAAAVVTVVVLDDSGNSPGSSPTPGVTVTTQGPTVTVTVTPRPSTTPSPSRRPSTPARRTFQYQPLWPFTTETEAAAWQQSYRAGGHQPWHLDPAQTARSFTTGFLDFEEIGLVVSRSVRGDEAFVSMGYRPGGEAVKVAAVVHLARLGQGSDAPWEVVGTSDSRLTLERPRYGAVAGSPLTVSGRITGVDESVRVDVRQASSGARLGSFCCVAAGGQRQPWSAQVTFQGATDSTLTVVAATGGHFQGVETFAVTAVRQSPVLRSFGLDLTS